jgi:hypothetical protein
MRSPPGRFAIALISGVVVLSLALFAWVGRSASDDAPQRTAATKPELRAELIQLRRDVVFDRVQVTVTNTRAQDIVVDRMQLQAPGFGAVPVVRADAPIKPGLQVNLPTPYGTPRCDTSSTGRLSVRLWVRTGGGPVESVTVAPTDPHGTLDLIHTRRCLARRLASEVRLTFGNQWRREGSGAAIRLHGVLRATLLQPQLRRDVTQVAGNVMYSVAPDRPPGSPATATSRLARLDAAHPSAAIPVVVSVSRCDGHTKGEIKQPYSFRVWIAGPGGPEQASTIAVTAADKAQLRLVCAF